MLNDYKKGKLEKQKKIPIIIRTQIHQISKEKKKIQIARFIR
jgi:hypothetical protein